MYCVFIIWVIYGIRFNCDWKKGYMIRILSEKCMRIKSFIVYLEYYVVDYYYEIGFVFIDREYILCRK